MVVSKPYTTQLQAGLGLVNETKLLLELWSPGMSTVQLQQAALASGRFPAVTARRLRNIVVECFGPRYLVDGGRPAMHLKRLVGALPAAEMTQLMLLYTSRASAILGDFVRGVYWTRYAGGYTQIANDDARAFVQRGIDDGRTAQRWSDTTVRRVAAYLTGCCADYGLLERGPRSSRRILSYRIAPAVAAYLAHELHYAGVGDNALVAHEDWKLFGLAREDVLEELKRLSLKGLLIVQAAGDVVRISWKHQTMEGLCDVLAQS
ncbi:MULTISPECIES: BrxA family protein [unclassified Variovorax]|uniref:BrxA family protein n=1 Tax=unclassified Variovorax TaxID=663243 RepID=UPI00076C1919|nr:MULTISPECIES: BrxA family protein [unclassified Variovorax]KWT98894.1 hypothetical protein APY03_0206 [Variovorax sp. WDL1]PNG56043.1 hypothetical protein CHC07_02457 [Variovorax sp. B4]PNG57467.1 hypothetical protein CHC06_02460 [Variovorax sp. B2]VTV10155.1 hypothetical protein WDL1CHR_01170 [Variovorax sp. WDL1]